VQCGLRRLRTCRVTYHTPSEGAEDGTFTSSTHAFEADEDVSSLPCTLFSWGRYVHSVIISPLGPQIPTPCQDRLLSLVVVICRGDDGQLGNGSAQSTSVPTRIRRFPQS
jgi:hypothetical protein